MAVVVNVGNGSSSAGNLLQFYNKNKMHVKGTTSNYSEHALI